MGKKKTKSLRSEELNLHYKIQTKIKVVDQLIDRLSALKNRISDEKEDLASLLREHKEIRSLLKEEEGYGW
jgi:glutaredoxin 2